MISLVIPSGARNLALLCPFPAHLHISTGIFPLISRLTGNIHVSASANNVPAQGSNDRKLKSPLSFLLPLRLTSQCGSMVPFSAPSEEA